MRAGAAAAAAVAAAILLATGCHHRRPPSAAGVERAVVGTYRGVVDTGEGRPQRFRLLLWAAPPDRIHAEFLTPVGGPATIVDAGGGRLAVTLVRKRTAYVGAASVEAIEAVAGVAVAVGDLARWILSGPDANSGEVRVTRLPEGAPGLPQLFEIRAGNRGFRIELRRLDAEATLAPATGTGAAPPGVVERPLEELSGALPIGEDPDPREGP